MYRFRTVEKLLDDKYKELENQEIYFADLKSLNDPMEGFTEVYWNGDDIVWKNFFKHYLLCFYYIYQISYLKSENDLFKPEIPIFLSEEELNTEYHKKIFNKICENFFLNNSVNKLIKLLDLKKTKTNQDEILFYLYTLHPLAFQIIKEVHLEYSNATLTTKIDPIFIENIFQEYFNFIHETNIDEKKIKVFFSIQNRIISQINLTKAYSEKLDSKKWFILYEFINSYLEQIMKLIHYDVYVSCFMENCKNTAVWGHYGDSHKGVCLKFKTNKSENGDKYINLECINGSESIKKNGEWIHKVKKVYERFYFKKMNYTNNFPQINFFTSLGVLPAPKLYSQWYKDSEGNFSSCSNYRRNEESLQQWRSEYWEKEKRLFIKLKDWEYEEEYRLILSNFGSIEQINERKLRYKFESLEAVIFGMKTEIEDKVKIMKIIEKKCKENNINSFDFYQSNYSPIKGEMEISRLDFIKFN